VQPQPPQPWTVWCVCVCAWVDVRAWGGWMCVRGVRACVCRRECCVCVCVMGGVCCRPQAVGMSVLK
jgi:hypothetical protein